jgi:hypothetical protein
MRAESTAGRGEFSARDGAWKHISAEFVVRIFLYVFGLAIVLLGLADLADAAGLDAAVAGAYGNVDLALPTPQSLIVCHGFGCRYRTPITLSQADQHKLGQLLATGRASAAAERKAIAAAVAWFELRVAPQTGTGKAVAYAGADHAGDPSQFDCIDASRNTTSLLVVLDQLKLLRHHQVRAPESRGFLIDGRLPHTTAVMREQRTGQSWAVDSWTHNNGEKPDVMPLEQWMAAYH